MKYKNKYFSKTFRSLIIIAVIIFGFNTANSQTLMFTTDVSSVTPGCHVIITNTSVNPPANSSYKWSFTNASISYVGQEMLPLLSSIIDNTTLFTIVLPSFDNTSNGENFLINLELVDANGNVLSVTPYAISLVMSSTLLPITTGTCHDIPYLECSPLNNLVCNGDFEYYSALPSTYGDLDLAEPWIGTFGTSDYYHHNGTNGAGTTYNFAGGRTPVVTGVSNKAYAGFYAYAGLSIANIPESREYIRQALKTPLVSNQQYLIECDISLANPSEFKTSDIGIIFSNGDIGDNYGLYSYQNGQNFHFNPIDVDNISTSGWTHLTATYTTPSGFNYDFMTFGHILPNANTTSQFTTHANIQYLPHNSAYYFVDNIKITPIPSTVSTHNPNMPEAEISQHNHWTAGSFSDHIFNYVIENPDPNITYVWEIISGTASNMYQSSGSSRLIDWTVPTTGNDLGEIKITQYKGDCTYGTQIYKVSKHLPFCAPGENYYEKTEWNISSQNDIPSNSIYPFIFLKGVTKISTNINLTGWIIYMAPNAKIALEPNCTLTIDNCVFNSCESMWDGISANSIGEIVIIKNSSNIDDAVYGVQSRNGAPLYIENTEFNNNLRSILVQDYKRSSTAYTELFYSGYIRANEFNNMLGDPNSNADYLTLKPPYSSEVSKMAIDIHNVENITIGSASHTKNIFNRSTLGIKSYNSQLQLHNNEFRFINDILNTGWTSFVQGAVFVNNNYANAPQFSVTSRDIDIGGAGSELNYFLNCHTGIFAMNVKADIHDNHFENCNLGVKIHEFLNNSLVEDNLFTNNVEGIMISKPTNWNRNIQVKNNVFPSSASLKTGISLINVSSHFGNIAQVSNNTIKFSGPKTQKSYGIILHNSNGIKVNSNHIARVNIPLQDIPNDWDNMIGMKISQSKACQITDNYIHSMTSIWTTSQCNLTQFSCNDFMLYLYGIYFGPSSVISEQGELGVAGGATGWNTNNKWSTSTSGAFSGAKKLATDANYTNLNWTGELKWYYGPNYIPKYVPNNLSTSNDPAWITAAANTTNLHKCVVSTTGTGTSTSGGTPIGNSTNNGTLAILEDETIDAEIRDFLFEDMMEGIDYLDFLNEFRAYDAEYLYDLLADNSSLMWLGNSNDVDYQTFFSTVATSNIGDFRGVYDYIEQGLINEAIAANNAITPTADIYTNLKTVLNIYLNTWCRGNFMLTETEYNTLFTIANQLPEEGGDGVYTARIMINYNPDDYGLAFRLQNKISQPIELLKLFPNPANDEVTINFDNAGKEIKGILKVYTLTGKLLMEHSFTTSSSFEIISVDNLLNGAYLFNLEIYNFDKSYYQQKSGKLIILK